jgi:hypothetical protein
MQPLSAMNNVQKARLLHALLLQEIPAFLIFTTEMCLYLVNNRDEVSKAWTNQMFGVDFWIELSKDAHLKIEKYGRQLEKSSPVFADQLFGGYGAIFLVHCLHSYVQQGRHTDPRFKSAIELFFDA